MMRKLLPYLLLALLAAPARAAEPREMGLLPPPAGDLLGWKEPGDLPALPENGELVVQKVRPADCRVVLGFVHSPVDGRPDSPGYNGVVQEYDDSQGYAAGHWQNVTYEYLKEPGVHVTLGDDGGFNYLVLRGGFLGALYRDVDALDGPGRGKLVADFAEDAGPEGTDHFRFTRKLFPSVVGARRVSFFRRDNLLADAQFLRVGAAARPAVYTGAMEFRPGAPVADTAGLGPDFRRLPADPKEQHPSNFERRFPEGHRVAYLLAEGAAGQAIRLAPETQAHFLTPELPAGTPVGAVRFDMELQGVPEGNLVCLAVQDPLAGSQELLRVDLRMGKSGRVRCLLDFPDQLTAEGRRFWVTLASQHGGTLGADSRISLLTVPAATARAEYLPYRTFLLKGYFYVLSEARPWNNKQWSAKWLAEYDGSEWNVQRVRPQLLELFTTLEHLHAVAPEDPVVSQYWQWFTRTGKPSLDPKDVPQLPSVPGVPRWAYLLSHAAREVSEIPGWWLTHRMAPNGELGGCLGDDTDMLQWWVPSALLDSEEFAPLARSAFRKISSLVLQHNLRDGVNLQKTDALHAYEEGQNHQAIMPLLFYGDPQAVEWLMTSARTVENWLARAPDGTLKWGYSGNEFGWETARKPAAAPAPEQDDNPVLFLHSHLMLAWYNGNPRAMKLLKEYVDGRDAVLPGAYGAGASVTFALYWFTGDPKYLVLPKADGQEYRQWSRFQPDAVVHGREARQQPWWQNYVRGWQQHHEFAFVWPMEYHREALCKMLEFVLYGNPGTRGGGASKYRYIWTEAEQFTDRVFLPVEVPAQAMLGGYNVRNKLWPAYAVSYEGLGKEFAGLVLEQGRDRLKLAMVNLRDRPRDGAFRVWQLDPGEYELKVGPDANDDGVMESVEQTRTLRLKRMSRVPVTLPARRLVLYELRQLRKLGDLAQWADPAISAADVTRAGGQVRVRVHNLGNAPIRDLVVTLLNAAGKPLGSARLPALDTPLDLVPRTAVVTLPLKPGAARVVLNPNGAIPEITDLNNTAPVP